VMKHVILTRILVHLRVKPAYLHLRELVRWMRRRVGAGGHGRRRAAMSPVVRPAATVGEPGIFAVVMHDRTVAGLGPLPNPKRGLAMA